MRKKKFINYFIKLIQIGKKMNYQNLTSSLLVITVRGMMYYEEALKLQAFLDMAEDEGLWY